MRALKNHAPDRTISFDSSSGVHQGVEHVQIETVEFLRSAERHVRHRLHYLDTNAITHGYSFG